MYVASRIVVATTALTLAGLTGWDSTARVGAQEPVKAVRSPRGGLLATAEGHRFETFFFPTGARVFPLDPAGNPIDTSHLSGTATFYHPDAPARPWFSRPLHVEPVAAGQSPTSLDLNIGLSSAPRKGAVVVVEVAGLGTQSAPVASFKVPLEFAAEAAPQPAAPEGSVAAGPRYVYGLGYYGYGYYAVPGPEDPPQPSPTVRSYSGSQIGDVANGSMSGHTVGPMHRDWSTGRSSPLARPWLRPND